MVDQVVDCVVDVWFVHLCLRMAVRRGYTVFSILLFVVVVVVCLFYSYICYRFEAIRR